MGLNRKNRKIQATIADALKKGLPLAGLLSSLMVTTGCDDVKGIMNRHTVGRIAPRPYYGIMMVKLGDADGLVSGAVHTTGDMLRPALQIIKTKPGIKVVSSSFLLDCPNKSLGHNGLLVYSDCVVVPCPTAEELASIAVSAAETARVLCGIEEPKVALLSFSTKGSDSRDRCPPA